MSFYFYCSIPCLNSERDKHPLNGQSRNNWLFQILLLEVWTILDGDGYISKSRTVFRFIENEIKKWNIIENCYTRSLEIETNSKLYFANHYYNYYFIKDVERRKIWPFKWILRTAYVVPWNLNRRSTSKTEDWESSRRWWNRCRIIETSRT